MAPAAFSRRSAEPNGCHMSPHRRASCHASGALGSAESPGRSPDDDQTGRHNVRWLSDLITAINGALWTHLNLLAVASEIQAKKRMRDIRS